MKQLLIGTGNRGKARFIKNLLSDLQVKFLSPQELGVSISVDENGDTVEENARIKALGYFRASGVATLSPDSGICIEVCQMISNPAFYVRRVSRDRGATDEEVLEHFSSLVSNLGGQTVGRWTTALALAASADSVICKRFERQTILTARPCPERSPGSPLQSMQLDPDTGRYLAQMSPDELRAYYRRSQGFYEFVKTHLHLIDSR
jgi:XTP/dITP diphosphohydrolase